MTIRLPVGSATSPSRARRGSTKFYEAASARLTLLAANVSVDRLGGGPAEINTPKGDIRIAEAVRGMVVPCTQADDVSGAAARGFSASLAAVTTVGLNVHATTAHSNVGIVRVQV
ncbi:hypothetical protein [Streptomyces sp. NPDC097640]|uniref:hypothetical protein n=1 Tax=Streptomyces sp. NPDC097640 TaxID=3157229 RepID=UPI003327F83E